MTVPELRDLLHMQGFLRLLVLLPLRRVLSEGRAIAMLTRSAPASIASHVDGMKGTAEGTGASNASHCPPNKARWIVSLFLSLIIQLHTRAPVHISCHSVIQEPYW